MADTAKPKANGKTGSRRRSARNNADSHFNGEKPEYSSTTTGRCC